MIKTDNENSKETANFAILGKAQGTDVNAPYYHTLVSTITPLYKMLTEDNVLVAIAKRCVEYGDLEPLTEYIYKLYKTLNNDNGDNFDVLSTNSTTIEKIHYSFIKNEYTFIQDPNSIMITDVVFLTPQMRYMSSFLKQNEKDKLKEISNIWVKYLSEQNLESMIGVFIDWVDFSIKKNLEHLGELFLNSNYFLKSLKTIFLSSPEDGGDIIEYLERFDNFDFTLVSKSLLDTETLIILFILHNYCADSFKCIDTLNANFGYDFSSYPGEITPYTIVEFCKYCIEKGLCTFQMGVLVMALCDNLKKITNAEIKELFSDLIVLPDKDLAVGDFMLLLNKQFYKNYLKRSSLTGKNLMFQEIAFMLYSAFY